MGQRKPRGRKHMFELGPNGSAVHNLVLPETKPAIEWVVAKGWVDAVESKDPGIFDVTTLEPLPEQNHDFTIRTSEGKKKYLQLVEFIGDPNFRGDYESALKQHSSSELLSLVLSLIEKKAKHYGDTKDVVLLIYTTDFRFNLMPIFSVLGTRFSKDPPPFERIHYASVKPDGSALVAVIHPFLGTLLNDTQMQIRLQGKVWTPGPEDVLDR